MAAPCAAQDVYPGKPIQIIVPTGPGGGTDTAARLLARFFNERLKWQVVVVNRLGAGTRMAGESVAKAPPDGYTLLMGINALATGPLVYNNMPYDALRDFAPVSLVLVVPVSVRRASGAAGEVGARTDRAGARAAERTVVCIGRQRRQQPPVDGTAGRAWRR